MLSIYLKQPPSALQLNNYNKQVNNYKKTWNIQAKKKKKPTVYNSCEQDKKLLAHSVSKDTYNMYTAGRNAKRKQIKPDWWNTSGKQPLVYEW